MNRIKLLFFIGIILIITLAIFSEVYLKNYNLIGKWNIPYDAPGFKDSYQYAWASESYALGYDPLIENPVNPRGHQLNYPRIWHIFFYLGVNESHANIIGTLVIILFFTGMAIFWFSSKFDKTTYLFLSMIFLSPATMLGVERSNIELIIFFIISIAIAVDRYSRIASLSVIEFASILKLYPVFGFVYLLKEDKRKFWKLFFIASTLFIIYIILTFNDLIQIYKTTPKLSGSSFGVNVWWMGLRNPRFFNIHISENIEIFFRIISYTMAFIILLITLYKSIGSQIAETYRDGEYLDIFRIGAAIYIGCFIFINNHDYRLIFLSFTIPQIIEWIKKRRHKIFSVSSITLIAMLFSLWSFFIMRFLGRKVTFLIEEFSNWVVLSGLLFLFFASLPEWFTIYLKQYFLFKKTTGTQ
jgi:hypothetical protein